MSGDFSHLRFVVLGLLPFCAILALSASTVIYLLTALRGQFIKLLWCFALHFPLDLVDLGFVLDSLWIHFDYFDSCYATFSFALFHAPLYQSFLLPLPPHPPLSALLHLQYQIEIKSQTQNEIVAEQASCQIKKGTMVEQKSDQSPSPSPSNCPSPTAAWWKRVCKRHATCHMPHAIEVACEAGRDTNLG